MAYRLPRLAPAAGVPDERRGQVGGRFCHGCGGIYPLFAGRHKGKPVYGKDHISSPCSHEGEPFDPADGWWEPAIEVLPVSD